MDNKAILIEKLNDIIEKLDYVYTDTTGCADCCGCCNCCYETSNQHEQLQNEIKDIINDLK